MQSARWKSYSAGQLIYSAGDPPDGLYGLGSGSLDIAFPLIGTEPVVIHRAQVGFWIGDVAELAGVTRIISLSAAAESRLLHLPSSAIQAHLAAKPEHWSAFYRLTAINSSLAVMFLSEALSLTVRARVCRQLLGLPDGTDEAAITQDELARLMGVARGTMRRCLTDLVNIGAIKLHYGKIKIIDRAALENLRNEQ